MAAPDPALPSPALPRGRWVAAAVLVVAILAAYANSLHAPFVYDDNLAIPENQTIRRLWPLSEVLLPKARPASADAADALAIAICHAHHRVSLDRRIAFGS